MSGENETGGLSPDEAAFFESRGETAPPAATPEPAAEVEAPAEAQATGEEAEFEESEDRGKDHRVPVAVVRAERQKRQEAEKRLKESDERWARADERMRLIAEAQQRQQEPQQPEPPPGPEDALGRIDYTFDRVSDVDRRLNEFLTAQQQAFQQQQQLQQLDRVFTAKAQEFSAQAPDFNDAFAFAREKRVRFLRLQGVKEQDLQAVLHNDELYVVREALQRGANPAEVIYEVAKEYGYQPKTADPQPDAGALIDAKAETVARAKSLSQAGGQATPRAVNAKALADMPDEEFEAFIAKQGSKGFRKALNS